MDSEENDIVKERPAQTDVRYRPGTIGFTSKNTSDSDHETEKSPYEKMLEDETEKENKRRQELGLSFVLGTPNNESDGTILFNYDEPPPAPPADEDEYRNQSFAMESDSTLNNALRRAIREQQDQEMNKRFMEGGSSGSSLATVGSTPDIEDQHLDPGAPVFSSSPTDPSEHEFSNFETKPEEQQTHVYNYLQHSLKENETSQETAQEFTSVPSHEQSSSQLQVEKQITIITPQSSQLQNQMQEDRHIESQSPRKQEQFRQTQLSPPKPDMVIEQHMADQSLPQTEQHNVQLQTSSFEETVHPAPNPTQSIKVRKLSFFKRFFGKK